LIFGHGILLSKFISAARAEFYAGHYLLPAAGTGIAKPAACLHLGKFRAAGNATLAFFGIIATAAGAGVVFIAAEGAEFGYGVFFGAF
jgi:hypothetical protein